MAWGGARPGAGRKTKADILGLAKTLEECVSISDEKEIWANIIKQAKSGSKQHAELYLAYKYGKPSEHIITENDTETVIRVLRDAGTSNTPQQATPGTGSDNQGG